MKSRKCAWLPAETPLDERIVWVRGNVFSNRCPKSLITAESLRYLDIFTARAQLGGTNIESLEAKTADALLTLQRAWQEENQDGEKQ